MYSCTSTYLYLTGHFCGLWTSGGILKVQSKIRSPQWSTGPALWTRQIILLLGFAEGHEEMLKGWMRPYASTKPITKAKHGTAVVSLDHIPAYLCLGPSSIITQWILPLFQFTAGGFMADSRHMALRPAAFPYEAHHNLQKRTCHRQRLSTLEHIVFFSRTSDHGYR